MLIVAHFGRGADFGGSQRTTSLAERLEERGASVEWQTIAPRHVGMLEKAVLMIRARPVSLAYHDSLTVLKSGPWDAAFAEHPYMAGYLSAAGRDVTRIVDFHDIHWWHLRDLSSLAGPLRRLYLSWQSRLMRAFEERIVRSSWYCLFPTNRELEWAKSVGPGRPPVLIPNVLPRREQERLEAVARARRSVQAQNMLLYVGNLTYPPNLLSLLRFLRSTWRAIHGSVPHATLLVAGESSTGHRTVMEGFAGVKTLGFVSDLNDLLCNARAAVLPLEAGAGSSLRILLFGLAGLPVIGSPHAFRGYEDGMGWLARNDGEWVEGIRACLSESPPFSSMANRARDLALQIQADPRPWDSLFDIVTRAAPSTPFMDDPRQKGRRFGVAVDPTASKRRS